MSDSLMQIATDQWETIVQILPLSHFMPVSSAAVRLVDGAPQTQLCCLTAEAPVHHDRLLQLSCKQGAELTQPRCAAHCTTGRTFACCHVIKYTLICVPIRSKFGLGQKSASVSTHLVLAVRTPCFHPVARPACHLRLCWPLNSE